MTVFQNKSLVKAYLEKNNKARKNGGKFRFRQKKFWHRNRYKDLILVSVADTETKFWSYTSLQCIIPSKKLSALDLLLNILNFELIYHNPMTHCEVLPLVGWLPQ